MSRFDNVISLGAWCQVSYQINRKYGKQSGSPFEWTVTPWSGMISVLRHGTESLAQQLIFKEDALSAKCLKYGMLLPHDFPAIEEKYVVFSAEKILQVRSKYKYKYEKMMQSISATNGKSLFIRMGGIAETGFAWPYLFDGVPLEIRDIENLVEVVGQRCLESDFAILIVQDSTFCHETLDKRLLPRNVFVADIAGRNDPTRWEGCNETWDEIFRFIENPGNINFIRLNN